MKEEKPNRAPIVFAGTKFYELLVETMQRSQEAALANDYGAWVLLLRQFNNWVSGFVADHELSRTLSTLQQKAGNLQKLMGDRNFKSHGAKFLTQLREEILTAESKLYSNAKDLLLKVGGEESLDWNEDELQRMME